MHFNSKKICSSSSGSAQGTIEYVVLLAIIVVIGLVVVVLSSSFVENAPSVSKGKSELYWSSQDLSIVDSAVDSNGDGIFRFSNNSVEGVTITGLNVDGDDVNVSRTKILGGITANISVSDLPPCVGGSRIYKVKVTYSDQYGILSTSDAADLIVSCTPDVPVVPVPADVFSDVDAPSIELISPYNNFVSDDGVVSFSYFVWDDNAVRSCSLLINDDVNQIVLSPSFGEHTFSVVYLPSEGIYSWDVNCVDWNNNWADNNGSGSWDVNYYIAPEAPAEPVYFAKSFGGGDGAAAYSVASDGNIYIAGYFAGTATFGNDELVSAGGSDIFVAKLDSDGNWLWAKSAGGDGTDSVRGIAVDSFDNLYLTGQFWDVAFFGSDIELLSANESGDYDIFVAKISSDGNWLWAKSAGSTVDDNGGYSIAIDSADNIYVAGDFIGTAAFDDFSLVSTDSSNVFIGKINSYGEWAWVQKAGSEYPAHAAQLMTDSAGNVYITGYFNSYANFGDAEVDSHGVEDDDIFVAKFSSEGELVWAVNAGSSGNPGEEYVCDRGRGLAVDTAGSIYIWGVACEGIYFGAIPLILHIEAQPFAAKLSSSGNWEWAITLPREVACSYSVGMEYGPGLANALDGNILVTGTFFPIIDSDEPIFGVEGMSTNYRDVFVAKLGQDGNWLWAKSSVAGADSRVANSKSIALDDSRNMFVTGWFDSTVSFDGTSLTSESEVTDGFIWKVQPAD
ncbi:MAG: SBBP repeat-containing protein [archaeon]